MTKYIGRFAPWTVAALMLTACRGEPPKADTALAVDTSLSRQLASASRDTSVQPQLRDIPASPPRAAEPAPRQRSRPRRAEENRAAAAPPPERTPGGNAETRNAPGSVAAAAGGAVGTIPGGAIVGLTAGSRVCTNTNAVGDHLTATVSSPVTGSNGASIPAGASVDLTITKLTRSTSNGEPVALEFAVNSVSFGGHTYPIDGSVDSASVERIRGATKNDDLKKVGAGAVIGAIAGGLLGHGAQGAVIGGAVGAAGGAGVAAATGAYDGCIATGGRIVVRLNSGVQVKV